MLFILFDVEVIFMYPWAVNIVELGWEGFISMITFVVILGLGLIYILKKGVLDWNNKVKVQRTPPFFYSLFLL